MANLKQLLSLDSESISILDEQENKSDFVRKAVKYYNANKNTIVKPEPSKMTFKGVKI